MSANAIRGLAVAIGSVLLVLGSIAAPASACACGGPAPIPGTEVDVDRETAMVRWNGELEEIVLQLDMRSDAGETGLIVPTPSPATVTAGDPGLFEALLVEIEPRVAVEWDWWGSLGYGDGAPAGGAPPEVLARVQLGPIEATTLAASDTAGLQEWLTTNGYALSDAISAELGPYVDEGWSFVALKLTGDMPFDGALDPITFTFETDSLVYPMRMSRAADSAQNVRLYVLGDHRAVVSSTVGELTAISTVAWAAPVEDTALAALGGFLTVVDLNYAQPSVQVTGDLAISDAATDDPVIHTYTDVRIVEVIGIPAGPLIVAAAVLLLVAALVIVLVARSRRVMP
ncbi:MAG: hypothetical protein JWP85_905 [Rhodoglobus sp.]|nr:hypothetical protein [Rhodoglobus sp.]